MTLDEALALDHLWLIKSEPHKYSWDNLVGEGRTNWDGVRNAQAAIFLRAMRKGDQCLFYHSNEGLAIVGIAEVVEEAFPDVTDPAGRYVAVGVGPHRAFRRPVTLAEMKAEPKLAGMHMFKQFRLSVVPVSRSEWNAILDLETKAAP
ncbi:MAG: EVE domain-containing protein [Caulobacteraceae bacterium]